MEKYLSAFRHLLCTCLMVSSASLYAGDKAKLNTEVEVNNDRHIPSLFNALTQIKLEGNLDEWQALTAFKGDESNQDNHPNNRLDWQKTWLANDNKNLYIAYQNQGKIPHNDWWAWEIYIDTDHNPRTGYAEFQNMGAEYLLQGNELYQYIGDENSLGEWSKEWKYIDHTDGQVDIATGTTVELAIPLKLLALTPSKKDKAKLHILFYGDNESFGGEGEMLHASSKGYFNYHVMPVQAKNKIPEKT